MTRLTASIVAIAFFLQQGNCCCGESVCNVWMSVIWASESCCSSHEHGDETCHHDEESDAPDHSHEHHLCVGTHLFYLDTAADAAIDGFDFVSWNVPLFEVIELYSVASAPLPLSYVTAHFDTAPTLPLRAKLQIFQI